MTVEDDPERAALLRAVAADLRRDDDEGAEQVAALVHRVSDLYDPAEETSTGEIYRAMRFVLEVKERGGIDR
jgi:hypothetical protein